MKKENHASLVGLIFTVVSFISTFTFIVPMLIVFPVVTIFESILGPASYERIGTTAIIFLSVIVLSALLGFFFYIFRLKQQGNEISISSFIIILVGLSFILHPLGFFLYVSTNWQMANDGQFIFAIFRPFAYTSIAYVIIGLITDAIRNHTTVKTIPIDSPDQQE